MHHSSDTCQELSFQDGTKIQNISFSLWRMKRPTTAETLSTNLSMLMDCYGYTKEYVAGKSGISSRMISYILKLEKVPSVESADALGKVFGLTGWHMIMPSLTCDIAKSHKHLDQLMIDYASSNEAGRDFVEKVAQREAKYKI